MTRAFIIAICLMFIFPAYADAATVIDIKKVEQLKEEVANLFEAGRFRRAIPLLEKILSIDPSNGTASRHLKIARQQAVELYCKRADNAFVDGNYEKSIEIWEDILEEYPGDMRVETMIELTKNIMQSNVLDEMYALVDSFLAEGDNESAVNELEKILMIRPDDEKAREMLITTRHAMKESMIESYYAKAEKFVEEGAYDMAIETWNSILDLDSEQEAASRLISSTRRMMFEDMYVKAKRAYEEGDYIGSREFYYKIMAENPTDEEIKKLFTRLEETISLVQRISEEGEVYDMLRKSFDNYIAIEGNVKAAIAASWYAVQLEPENKLALSIRKFLEKKHPAVVLSMEAPVKDVNLIDQYLFAALNHIYEGRYDRAIEECSIILELQPKNILAMKRLGSAYFAMEKRDKARETWEAALKVYPNDAELKQFLRALY